MLDDEGYKLTLEYTTLGEMLREQKNLQCLLLNACDSMNGIAEAIAPLVIGMIDEIDDEEAIEFTKGFYDALASGRSPDDAFSIGCQAMAAKGMDSNIVTKMYRSAVKISGLDKVY